MDLDGDILLSRGLDGRWYLVRLSGWDDVGHENLGRPEGYATHSEGAVWRSRFRRVQAMQEAPQNSFV
jgi:hypothetical protein